MRQIYPTPATVDGDGLARLYAYPRPAGSPWWVRANMVSSLDGAATLAGRSGGLSGDADRQVFALLRSLADVILVGAGTARAEGYRPVRPGREGARWARLREGRPPAPPIAVVSRSLDLSGPLLAGAPGQASTIVITSGAAPARERAAAAQTAEVIVTGEDRVDLRGAVGALAARGYRRILTEGGPHLLGEVIAAGLLDELCLTVSPVLAGPGPGRIVAGPAPAAAAGPGRAARGGLAALSLAHVLADEGYLLCRYVRPA